MTLDQIDDAIRLRNYRKNVMDLADTADCGLMRLSFSGCPYPDSHISLRVVRDAVIAECRRLQAEYEAELGAMGITVP